MFASSFVKTRLFSLQKTISATDFLGKYYFKSSLNVCVANVFNLAMEVDAMNYDSNKLLSNHMCTPMTGKKEEICPEKLEEDYCEDSDQYEYTLNIKNDQTHCVDEDVNIGYAQLNETDGELPNPNCDGLTEKLGAIQTPERDACAAHIPNPVEMQETTAVGTQKPSTVEIRRVEVERMNGNCILKLISQCAE